VKGDTLTFAPSGWTYGSTFVLYDYETESMWFPYVDFREGSTPLVCISGHYADIILSEMPSTLTTWKRWKQQHPQTKYLKQ